MSYLKLAADFIKSVYKGTSTWFAMISALRLYALYTSSLEYIYDLKLS